MALVEASQATMNGCEKSRYINKGPVLNISLTLSKAYGCSVVYSKGASFLVKLVNGRAISAKFLTCRL
jgi:hypothetical protein